MNHGEQMPYNIMIWIINDQESHWITIDWKTLVPKTQRLIVHAYISHQNTKELCDPFQDYLDHSYSPQRQLQKSLHCEFPTICLSLIPGGGCVYTAYLPPKKPKCFHNPRFSPWTPGALAPEGNDTVKAWSSWGGRKSHDFSSRWSSTKYLNDTVDGSEIRLTSWGWWFIPLFTGFHTC